MLIGKIYYTSSFYGLSYPTQRGYIYSKRHVGLLQIKKNAKQRDMLI